MVLVHAGAEAIERAEQRPLSECCQPRDLRLAVDHRAFAGQPARADRRVYGTRRVTHSRVGEDEGQRGHVEIQRLDRRVRSGHLRRRVFLAAKVEIAEASKGRHVLIAEPAGDFHALGLDTPRTLGERVAMQRRTAPAGERLHQRDQQRRRTR